VWEISFFGDMVGGEGVDDVPPSGGVWGTGSPGLQPPRVPSATSVVLHRPGWPVPAVGGVVGLFGNASASQEWAESLQLPNSYACMAGCFPPRS